MDEMLCTVSEHEKSFLEFLRDLGCGRVENPSLPVGKMMAYHISPAEHRLLQVMRQGKVLAVYVQDGGPIRAELEVPCPYGVAIESRKLM